MLSAFALRISSGLPSQQPQALSPGMREREPELHPYLP
jgi:hypothetical protein